MPYKIVPGVRVVTSRSPYRTQEAPRSALLFSYPQTQKTSHSAHNLSAMSLFSAIHSKKLIITFLLTHFPQCPCSLKFNPKCYFSHSYLHTSSPHHTCTYLHTIIARKTTTKKGASFNIPIYTMQHFYPRTKYNIYKQFLKLHIHRLHI